MKDNPRRVGQDATGAEGNFQGENFTASSAPFQFEKNPIVALRQTTDEAAFRFLQLILPEQDPYIAWIKKSDGRKYNLFAPTISELWAIIKSANDAGHTVYHACANFHEARHDPKGTTSAQRRYGRTQKNAKSAKSLWLDMDAGPDKPYPNAEEAHHALLEFCKEADLPSPLIVWSGNGLHVYWPLERSLDRGTWEPYAHGLKTLCIKHGLHADHSRTTDISSVLRTPGTHHRKGEAKEVLCGSIVGPFPISAFPIVAGDPASCTKAHISKQSDLSDPSRLPRPDYLKALPDSGRVEAVIRSIDRGRDFGPASGAVAVDHCGQLAEFRDEQGQIPEPLWYAGLGVLAHCEDGEQLAHTWSSGDPRYSNQETQERVNRARGFGPTKCARFQSLNPSPCERCPHWQKIVSPIQLGREAHVESDKEHSEASSGAESAFPLRWHGDQDFNFQPKWLVKNMLPETGAGLLSGQWGTFKTFIAIDLAASVMTGGSFAGRPVKRKGGVLFIAAEGASEIPIRLHGLAEAKYPKHEGNFPFAWSGGCTTLMQEGAIEQLEQIAREAVNRMRSKFGVKLVLIVIDTMSAAAGFSDENSSSEGQQAMNVLYELSKNRNTRDFCQGGSGGLRHCLPRRKEHGWSCDK
jgi:hypothetical protein